MVEDVLKKYFDVFGFCRFEIFEDKLIECKAKQRIPKNAKSVITVLFPYYLGEEAYKNANVSRYAAVSDYHSVAEKYFKRVTEELKRDYPEYEFVNFQDNSPIPEVYAALKSGLGMKGKNGLLINEKYGSWVFIGEIVTDLEIPCEDIEIKTCPDCGKCADACPTGVLKEAKFDREKCLSHITQKKGEIPEPYKALIKKHNCVWGCDECQKACPYNANAQITSIEEFVRGAVVNITSETPIEGRAFAWRGKKVIDRNLKVTQEDEF